MMIYGDRERSEDAQTVKSSALCRLLDARRISAGVVRHEALVNAFIRMSELAQGIADAEFEILCRDGPSVAQQSASSALVAMAKVLDRSWRSGFASEPEVELPADLLAGVAFAGRIRTRACEGYAHYALYPESYLEAARRSGMDQSSFVIGIRSIGLGLAALVAAGLDARTPISLRPIGHPFDRRIRADPSLIADAAADISVRFAVVDEGPGLSGSSFAAVSRWLRDHGISDERISFFPSHGGLPGEAASPEIQSIWATATKYEACPDTVVNCRNGLAAWIGDLTGAPVTSLGEVFAQGFHSGASPLPNDARFERRKFLARTREGLWLAKFAGLGEIGERKLHDAKLMARAGFIPEVVGIRYGFIINRWVEGRPLPNHFDRPELLRKLAAYLAFRARNLVGPVEGAALETLREMAIRNTNEALGAVALKAMETALRGITAFQGTVRRVRTDNRLHTWEWICTDRGLMKTDAIDHCEAHDLVGCQDITWDVAGAVVEHRLSEAEARELCMLLSEAGGPKVHWELMFALLHCYLAFQLGLWSSASAPGGRCNAPVRRLATSYAVALRRILRQAAA